MQRTRLATDIRFHNHSHSPIPLPLSLCGTKKRAKHSLLHTSLMTGDESFRLSWNSAKWKLEIISA